MFPCVCRVIDHGRPHNVVKKSLTLSAAPRVPRFYSNHIWRHLWLITKQTYGNTESISLKAHDLDYLKRSGLFPWSVMGKKTSKLDKVAVTHMLVFSTLSNPSLLRVYSFSVDFYLLPQKNMSRFYFNNKKRIKMYRQDVAALTINSRNQFYLTMFLKDDFTFKCHDAEPW